MGKPFNKTMRKPEDGKERTFLRINLLFSLILASVFLASFFLLGRPIFALSSVLLTVLGLLWGMRMGMLAGLQRELAARKEMKEELDKRLTYERLISDVFALRLRSENTDRFIDECIKIMGEGTDVSRIYIFEHHVDTDSADNTFEWAAPGVTPQRENLQGVPSSAAPWWMKMMKNNEVINYKDIEDIPGEEEKEILRPQGIKSVLVIPLFVSGIYYGFMGFDECRHHREWRGEDVNLLCSIAQIITGAIERSGTFEGLKQKNTSLEAANLKLKDVKTAMINMMQDMKEISEDREKTNVLLGMRVKDLKAINVIASILSRSLDLNDVLNGAMDEVVKTMGVDVAGVYLLNESDGLLHLEACRGVSVDLIRAVDKLKVGEGVSGRAVESGKPLVVQDVPAYQGVMRSAVRESGLKTLVSIPLRAKNAVLGALSIGCNTAKVFSDGEINLLSSICSHIALSIDNIRLYEEQKVNLEKIEEANRRKTEFVSGVSHELRTPLASIKGFTSTVRSDKAMDEKTRDEFLKIVEDETDRLTRLIEDLLDLSRIESGRLKIKEEKIDIAPLIKKCVEGLMVQSEERNIQLQLMVPDSLPEILADRDKITQILINLLSNAIKYTQNGGKVTVMGGSQDGAVIVEVSDTGVGISKENLPHIFERFFRIEKPGIEAKGTGLGLSIAKALAEVFHGRVDVKSEPGRGSTFSLTLPVVSDKGR